MVAINNGNVVEYVERSDSSIYQKMRNNTIRVPRGGEYELILPDGTHVWINSDSELSFPARFDSTKREVSLSGEAYFSVRKDKKRPFTVKVGQNVEVKVLGTQFNLQAYPDAQTIETTLCEGSVNVSDGKQKVTLTPSQQAGLFQGDHEHYDSQGGCPFILCLERRFVLSSRINPLKRS